MLRPYDGHTSPGWHHRYGSVSAPITLATTSSGTAARTGTPVTSSSPTRSGRLDVGVIGSGRVGAVLGAALSRAGHRVVAASAVSDASRSRAETLLPDAQIVPPPEVCEVSELVLMTVPDDQLPGLVEGLAALGAWRTGQLVAHASGRYGISVLDPARVAG